MSIGITSAHEAVDVDLWGALFTTQRVTRSRQKALVETQRKIEALTLVDGVERDDIDPDALVALWAEMLDHLLAPAEGKRKKASAWIVEKWQQDDLTIPELQGFIDRLGEASRPT